MPNKVIIVSGGSDGLGKEISKLLSESNQVIILAHNEEKLKAVSSEIHCDYAVSDVSKFDQLEKAIAGIIDKYHRIDSLVNCAGIWAQGQITENSQEEIDNLLDVNTKGTIFLCKAVIPQMEKQGRGEIINIISQDGLCAKKNRSLYHASKWAITGFTKCLQEDLSDKHIKVTGVYPGLMNTSLFEKQGVQRDLTNSLSLGDVAKTVQYVINLSQDTHIPEIGIKHLLNTQMQMDDTNSNSGLNLDPDLITTQGNSQVASPPPATDVIDITPGGTTSSDASISLPPLPPLSTPTPVSTPEMAIVPPLPPLSVPEPVAISPVTEPALHLVDPSVSDPKPNEFIPKTDEPSLPGTSATPLPPISLAPQAVPEPVTQVHEETKTNPNFSINNTSPLFENPEDVKPMK